MPNRFHSPRADNSPGLNARVAQVKQAYNESAQYAGEMRGTGRAMTGNAAVKKQREVAERALERQIRFGRGQYPVR